MKQLRKEDLSLHHYLRFNVLHEYIETDVEVPLEYLPNESQAGSYIYEAQSTRSPSPISLGRGWVYLDDYSNFTEQTSMVTVYDRYGSVISGSEYMVDYIDGRIVTSGSTVPAAVTYKYFYVALVNDWETIENSGVPVVAVILDDYEKVGFQLGGGQRIPRRGRLEIFANDQAERDDLLELIYDGINQKCCPNQDWPKGSMLDWNGCFNDEYVYELAQYRSSIHFESVRGRIIYPPLVRAYGSYYTMLSDLNRYRARVDFSMFHWKEY